MENCLVTKLKSVINNNNLSKIGEWIIPVKGISTVNYPDSQQAMSIRTTAPVTVTTNNGGFVATSLAGLANETTSVSVNANTSTALYFSNGNYNIHIDNKYAIVNILLNGHDVDNKSIIAPDLDNLEYSSGASNILTSYHNGHLNLSKLSKLTSILKIEFTADDFEGDILDIHDLANLTSFIVRNRNLTGNLSDIGNKTAMTELTISNANVEGNISHLSASPLTELRLDYTHVSGNISSLAAHASRITKLYLTKTQVEGNIANLGTLAACTYLVLDGTNVEGAIESVATAAASVRNSGQLMIDTKNTGITYNGTLVANRAIITFTGSGNYTVAVS